jgi:hypothetical protein
MRIKLIAIATALAALAFGVTTSHAALQNALQASMKFKKAGGPGSIQLQLVNVDDTPLPDGKPLSARQFHDRLYDGGLVPQRISKIVIQTSSAKFNSKALPYCALTDPNTGQKKDIPTRATGMTGAEEYSYVPGDQNAKAVSKNCPAASIIGKGDFTATVGNPGSPYDPGQAGALEGTVIVYNYKPAGGHTLGTVARLHVENPVPATQYIYSGITKSGVFTADVPSRAELPSNLEASIPAGEVSMTSIVLKLTAPKPPKGKGPIFTVKSFSNLNVYGQLVRE